MPFTPKQVRLFMSDASPLSAVQKEKVKRELHANPALGHARKGSAAMKRGSRFAAAARKRKRNV